MEHYVREAADNVTSCIPADNVTSCNIHKNPQSTANEDYEPLLPGNTVTFSSGFTRVCQTIQILGGTVKERNDECFQVNAQSIVGSKVNIQAGEGTAEVCIMDDDC